MYHQLIVMAAAAILTAPALAIETQRSIKEVSAVVVSCPIGTVPRLPDRVWVTYSDGHADYRQIRWTNSAIADEQAEADLTKHTAGSTYTINGHIVGDESTAYGFPITATINIVSEPYAPPASEVAHTFPLADISLDGNNLLTSNRDEALAAICSWDVAQQLYNFRDTYGLSTDGYSMADGWDSPDTKLKGHGTGHYMSSVAQAYAVTRDPKQKEILRKNITRLVNELRECQERTFVFDKSLGRYREARDLAPESEIRNLKGTWAAFNEYKQHPENYGYGYLNAIPAQHCALIEAYRPYNNSDWVWAPYYTIHKELAGLIDIATYFDDTEIADKALLIAKDMGLWVWNRMHYRTYVKKDGTQDERRARPGNRYEMWDMYIAGELGGISESLARIAQMTSDKAAATKLLEAATYFDAPKFYEPLSRNIDDIRTRHANQHIPMIIGALKVYKGNGEPRYYNIAENFWRLVQARYVYAPGGVGNGEMFRQPYTQTLSMATNGLQEGEATANPDINETCCTYNLLKLSRDLNCYNPNDAAYMDYYEQALYNQIVGSLNPNQYQTCYQYAVGLNATKPFGNETPQSSCCGGTGSENHTKYQEAAYFASNNTLWVALYLPTTLNWKAKGVTIKQECAWPAQSSTITVTSGESNFSLKLRIPRWATNGFSATLNGKPIANNFKPGSYVEIPTRLWKKGDRIDISMPYTVHIEYGMDKLPADVASLDGTTLPSSWVGTIMYGPLAMTGTGASTWRQATLTLDSRLSQITINKQRDGIPSLTIDGKTFLPDYYRHENSTHYYRITTSDIPAEQTAQRQAANLDELNSLLSLATQRQAEQEHWNNLTTKVPDYAPWAPNGYQRLLNAITKAKNLISNDINTLSPDDVETASAQLNKAINTMRPGNLAEVEDLRPLTALLRRAGMPDDTSSNPLREAVDYGRMVVRYVTDGSGTHDMISSAIQKLNLALGNN